MNNSEEKVLCKSPERRWYVMLHRRPSTADVQLKRESSRVPQDGEPSYEYFIPFCFLSHIAKDEFGHDDEAVRQANQLRQDLHDFVFIRTTPVGIAHLVDSPWNKDSCYHLHHYRDSLGREVTLGATDMEYLIRIFNERRIRFSIGMPTENIAPGMTVRIVEEGNFYDRTARVIAVKHTAAGISLNLGLPMFNDTKELKLKDVPLSSVYMEEAPADIIGERFLENSEEKLLEVLSHRVNHRTDKAVLQQDAASMNHLFLYSYVTVRHREHAARFRALMLLCATLRYDRESSRVLADEVRSLLADERTYSPSTLAYLHFSLYAATRDANHRTAGKQLVLSHPDGVSPLLFRLMSLIRRLRGKRCRTHATPQNIDTSNI